MIKCDTQVELLVLYMYFTAYMFCFLITEHEKPGSTDLQGSFHGWQDEGC